MPYINNITKKNHYINDILIEKGKHEVEEKTIENLLNNSAFLDFVKKRLFQLKGYKLSEKQLKFVYSKEKEKK